MLSLLTFDSPTAFFNFRYIVLVAYPLLNIKEGAVEYAIQVAPVKLELSLAM